MPNPQINSSSNGADPQSNPLANSLDFIVNAAEFASRDGAFRFLKRLHDEEKKRRSQERTAFIPAPTIDLQGLGKVNADLVGFVQRHTGHNQATLDMDATLIESHSDCLDGEFGRPQFR